VPVLGQFGGSRAIESNIRRVINLRMKGNGIFWKQPAAESMLQLPALVISNRWDDRLTQMRSYKRTTHRTDWSWTPQSMTRKSEDANSSQQTQAFHPNETNSQNGNAPVAKDCSPGCIRSSPVCVVKSGGR